MFRKYNFAERILLSSTRDDHRLFFGDKQVHLIHKQHRHTLADASATAAKHLLQRGCSCGGTHMVACQGLHIRHHTFVTTWLTEALLSVTSLKVQASPLLCLLKNCVCCVCGCGHIAEAQHAF